MVFTKTLCNSPTEKKDNITNLTHIFNRKLQNFLVQEGKSADRNKRSYLFL